MFLPTQGEEEEPREKSKCNRENDGALAYVIESARPWMRTRQASSRSPRISWSRGRNDADYDTAQHVSRQMQIESRCRGRANSPVRGPSRPQVDREKEQQGKGQEESARRERERERERRNHGGVYAHASRKHTHCNSSAIGGRQLTGLSMNEHIEAPSEPRPRVTSSRAWRAWVPAFFFFSCLLSRLLLGGFEMKFSRYCANLFEFLIIGIIGGEEDEDDICDFFLNFVIYVWTIKDVVELECKETIRSQYLWSGILLSWEMSDGQNKWTNERRKVLRYEWVKGEEILKSVHDSFFRWPTRITLDSNFIDAHRVPIRFPLTLKLFSFIDRLHLTLRASHWQNVEVLPRDFLAK